MIKNGILAKDSQLCSPEIIVSTLTLCEHDLYFTQNDYHTLMTCMERIAHSHQSTRSNSSRVTLYLIKIEEMKDMVEELNDSSSNFQLMSMRLNKICECTFHVAHCMLCINLTKKSRLYHTTLKCKKL